MVEIKVGDLIKTSDKFGIVLEARPQKNDTKYRIYWFFNDGRKNPVHWLDGYNALRYRVNVLTAVGK
jgi:hypothetical protein